MIKTTTFLCSLLSATLLSTSVFASEYCPPISALTCDGQCSLSDKYQDLWYISSQEGELKDGLLFVEILDNPSGIPECQYGTGPGRMVEIRSHVTFKPNTTAPGNHWNGENIPNNGPWFCNETTGGVPIDCPMLRA